MLGEVLYKFGIRLYNGLTSGSDNSKKGCRPKKLLGNNFYLKYRIRDILVLE